MPRFYLPQLPNQGELALPESIVRHIHVLRLQAGDGIVLFDGRGMRVAATLRQVEKRKAACTIGSVLESDSESPLQIHLIQAVPSGERMDFTLQKSVELGVTSITPVLSERCVVRLQGERADKRVQRWQEIAISACEQCGRDTVPPPDSAPVRLLAPSRRRRRPETADESAKRPKPARKAACTTAGVSAYRPGRRLDGGGRTGGSAGRI